MRRLLLALATSGAILIGPLASATSAHTELVVTYPVEGAVLDAAPAVVRAIFDSEVEPSSAIVVRGSSGVEVPGAGGLDLDDLDRATLVFEPDSPLRNDRYEVEYRAVMVADGDTTAGSFSFEVADPDGIAAPAAEPSGRSWPLGDLALPAALVATAALAYLVVRRSRHATVALILVAAVLVAGTEHASAHASFERAEPDDGGFVVSGDEPIRLWLSEPVNAEFSRFTIRSTAGEEYDPVSVEITAPEGGGLATITLPELAEGTYSINWRVLSERDGHFSQGIYVIGLGIPPDIAAVQVDTVRDEVPKAEPPLRWVSFLGMSVMVASLALGYLVLSGRSDVRRPLLSTGAIGAAVALVAGAGLLVSQTVVASGAQPPDISWSESATRLLTGTRWGALWVVRQTGLVLTGWALLMTRSRRSLPFGVMAGIGAAVVLSAQSLGSHAAGVRDGLATSVLADLAHLIAACVWAGSLLLVAFVLTQRRTGTSRRDLLRPVAGRFGLLAGASVAVLVVTGLYAAGKQVASVGDLLTTGYGKVLIAKSALVGAALLAGGSAAVALRRTPERPSSPRWGSGIGPARLGPIGLTRLVVIEASLVAVVLLFTGVLTSTAPTNRADPGSGEALEARSELIDDVVVTVAVKPNRPGDNIYVVHASSIVRPTPAPIDRVLLRFDLDEGDFGTETVVLEELEPGRFQAGGDQLRFDGSWKVEAVVRRSGLPDVVAPFDWRLSTGAVADSLVSSRPLEPILNAMALTLLAAIAVTVLTAFVLRHRPTPVPSDRPVDLVGTEAA